MKVTITGLNMVNEGLQRDLRKMVEKVASLVIQEAVKATPRKTGYARSQWNKSVGEHGFQVENHVPYIGALEKGHSKQAPKGILMPTISNVKRKLK
jgi:precorrin isomerase